MIPAFHDYPLEPKMTKCGDLLYIRGFTKFGIKVAWRLQFLEYLRTLSLKFQKTLTKIEVVLALPCWLSQFSWDSQQGRARKTSILVRVFWNFKLKVLKYPRNCRLHATLIPNLVKPLTYVLMYLLDVAVYFCLYRMYYQDSGQGVSSPGMQ